MKLGIGLYRHQLTEKDFSFAKQAACSHVIIHLANYYKDEIVSATDTQKNYGKAVLDDPIWSLENLLRLQEMAKDHGVEIYGIENFNPGDWYDVLLDGPKRDIQIQHLQQIVSNIGKAGIKTIGYNFSLAGVWGHSKEPVARGGALATCFDATKINHIDAPIPNGQVWNMTYDENAPAGYIQAPSNEMLWNRIARFLHDMLPVAEQAQVSLALHPDDPPMEMLRSTPRLVYQPELYQKLIDIDASPANKLEFCMGSIQEMTHGSIYESLDTYLAQKRISYIHFRNVIGKVPKYREVFIDEGDIDMIRCIKIMKKHNFQGVLVPDHTPMMACGDSWYAGMSYALGYMKALLDCIR